MPFDFGSHSSRAADAEMMQMMIFFIILIFSGVVGAVARGKRLGPVLVLKQFRVSEMPEDGTFIRVVGRTPGFLGWLLSALGLGTETTMRVTRDAVTLRAASLSGERHDVAPMTSVASTHCGFAKPIELLIIGGILVLISLFGAIAGMPSELAAVMLIIGAVLAIYYFTKRTMFLMVVTSGGTPLALQFGSSVVERAKIDFEDVQRAISILNSQLISIQSPVSRL